MKTHRVDERVRALDVADRRVERQAESDRVVQSLLETDRPQQQHVSETQRGVSVCVCVGHVAAGGDT